MILDGRTIVEKNLVTFPDDLYPTDEQVQPNGVDLRLHSVKLVAGRPEFPERGRISAKDVQISEVPLKDGWFDLAVHPTGNYLVDFRESGSIPDGYCAQIITRSSLVRVGVDLFTGLWDTGWQGQLGGSLRLRNPIRLQYGTRLAQIIFMKAAFNGHRYTGIYNNSTTQTAFAR